MRNEELFVPVPDTDGKYMINMLGEVKSMNNRGYNNKFGKLLNIGNVLGYPTVRIVGGIYKNTTFVHRLLALTFIPNPENKPQVNHKDGNKLNNDLSNLEWVTCQENIQHSFRNNLQIVPKGKDNWMCKAVLQFTKDGFFVAEYFSIREASQQTGINLSNISSATKGIKRLTAGGYKWVSKEKAESAYHDIIINQLEYDLRQY